MPRLTSNKYWTSFWKPSERLKFPIKIRDNEVTKKPLFTLLKKYLPKGNKTVIEIGCAPASWLIYFNENFGYAPYGVEYTKKGIELCNKNLKSAKVEGTIYHEDFFSKRFLDTNKNKYDIVFSSGFIEHFDDPTEVVLKHLSLVKKGGILIIIIPRITGILKSIQRVIDNYVLKTHNTDIMDSRSFNKLFPEKSLNCLYSGPVNHFNLGILNARNKILLKPLYLVQSLLFNRILIKNKKYSPNLIYIGKRK